MKTSTFPQTLSYLVLAAAVFAGGCKSQPAQTASGDQPATQPAPQQPASTAATGSPAAPPPTAPAPSAPPPSAMSSAAPAPAPVLYTLPAGTPITVRVNETIDSRTAEVGQAFTATVEDPVTVRGAVVIHRGASASGTITGSQKRGKIKGEGLLALRLDSVRADGRTYQVSTSSIDKIEKGKGKRTALFAGGGAGLGALIGGLAGGGKGALIGGLAGGGAGTGAGVLTGNSQVVIPAESLLTFRLTNSVTMR